MLTQFQRPATSAIVKEAHGRARPTLARSGESIRRIDSPANRGFRLPRLLKPKISCKFRWRRRSARRPRRIGETAWRDYTSDAQDHPRGAAVRRHPMSKLSCTSARTGRTESDGGGGGNYIPRVVH